MRTYGPIPAIFLCCMFACSAHAQVPQMINYQGRVVVNGTNYHGTGQFKFALVDGTGSTSFWSNDGTSTDGSEPTASVALQCSKGLFSVALGDGQPIPNTVFTNNDVRIRTWFSDGGGFDLLSPDQRIAAVGYAMVAASVDGDPYVEKSGDTMIGALRVTDGTGPGGTGGHLHIGTDQANADPKLVNFGDIEGSTGQGWVSIGERGQDDTLEIRAQKVYFSPSAYGNYAVGIGVSNPVERLEVAGAINLADATTSKAGNIRWTGTDFEGYDGTAWVSLTERGATTASGDSMVLIPAGDFQMGDHSTEGAADERPVHSVYISAFYVDKHEVSKWLWDEVSGWAVYHGYGFGEGDGNGARHPVNTVNWYDCAKWCNARSEKEGLTPVYYTSTAQTTIYRKGETNIMSDCVNWSANGYRLPTEAEWEKAARGGLTSHHYPWPSAIGSHSNNIDGSKANYPESGDPYETEPIQTTPIGYYDGNQTTNGVPGGSDMANGYGLYDMAGNVWEWCWDWYQSDWYDQPGATNVNTRGPQGPSGHRVLHGGSWNFNILYLRCSNRNKASGPGALNAGYGFRCVRSVQ